MESFYGGRRGPKGDSLSTVTLTPAGDLSYTEDIYNTYDTGYHQTAEIPVQTLTWAISAGFNNDTSSDGAFWIHFNNNLISDIDTIIRYVTSISITADGKLHVYYNCNDANGSHEDISVLSFPADHVTFIPTTTITSTEVQSAIEEVYDDSQVVMTTTAGTGNIFKSYTFTQAHNNIGTIDIPKDFVIKTAKLIKYVKDDATGKYYDIINDPSKTTEIDNLPSGVKEDVEYIDLEIYVKESGEPENTSHIYIDVTTLVNTYTGVKGDRIEVTIPQDGSYKVSADIIADSVAESYLSPEVRFKLNHGNGSIAYLGTSATIPTTGVIGDAYMVDNVLYVCTVASTDTTDATYVPLATSPSYFSAVSNSTIDSWIANYY